MRDDAIALGQAQVRAADGNSLLRLYDLNREARQRPVAAGAGSGRQGRPAHR